MIWCTFLRVNASMYFIQPLLPMQMYRRNRLLSIRFTLPRLIYIGARRIHTQPPSCLDELQTNKKHAFGSVCRESRLGTGLEKVYGSSQHKL
eukprot:m.25775 g.25775  ORF g.25775 m.25775 type:complete len:92 (+) comp8760_c0_seq2:865-1140(+)